MHLSSESFNTLSQPQLMHKSTLDMRDNEPLLLYNDKLNTGLARTVSQQQMQQQQQQPNLMVNTMSSGAFLSKAGTNSDGLITHVVPGRSLMQDQQFTYT